MPAPRPAQLERILRLRGLAGTLSRAGEYPLAAEALRELSRASRDTALPAEALRRARESALLTQLGGGPLERAQALVHLGSLLLEHGQWEAARDAAYEAERDIAALDEDDAPVALERACVDLLGGMAELALGDGDAARTRLRRAVDRFVAGGRAAGASSALLELCFVDLVDGAPEPAAVCLTYACDFRRLDGDRAGAAAIAAAGADWMSDDGHWEPAVRLLGTALADAAAAGESLLAAQLAARLADGLSALGRPAEEVRAATHELTRRCAALDLGHAEHRALHADCRMRAARLAPNANETVRQVEAAFDVGLRGGDGPLLTRLLDQTVSGLVDGSLPDAVWTLLQRLPADLRRGNFGHLAAMAEAAVAELVP